MVITRRSFLAGLLAAPIVVRTGILMPVKKLEVQKPVLIVQITPGRAFAFTPGDAYSMHGGGGDWGAGRALTDQEMAKMLADHHAAL